MPLLFCFHVWFQDHFVKMQSTKRHYFRDTTSGTTGGAAGQDGKASSDSDFVITLGSSNPTAISGVSRDGGCAGGGAVDRSCSGMGRLEARRVDGDSGATKDEKRATKEKLLLNCLTLSTAPAWWRVTV